MTSLCTQLDHCCACGARITSEHRVLDLGFQPLANNFGGPSAQQTFPLELMGCARCQHLQLRHSVDPATLFSNYKYVSGTSQTLLDFFDSFAKDLLKLVKDPAVIVDVASNDGSQLLAFKRHAPWCVLIGVDPAKNLMTDYERNGLIAVRTFFTDGVCTSVLGERKADIIVMQNVVAHTPTPSAMLTAARNLLNTDGIIVVQVSQTDMLESGQFDTLYHEHISYFNDKSMTWLARSAGLAIVNKVIVPVHGNSAVYIMKHGTRSEAPLKMEQSSSVFTEFKNAAQSKIASMQAFQASPDRDLIGIGAAAKSSVCIHAAKLYGLKYVVDQNPLKIGTYVPGTRIPVVGLDHLATLCKSTDAIVFAWNFFKELREKVYSFPEAQRYVRLVTFFPTLSEVTYGDDKI